MNIKQFTPQEWAEALRSGDARQVNAALKSLYMSQKVNAKVQAWARDYKLQNKQPEDVLQEAVMLLYDIVLEGRYRGSAKPETFLLGICLNLIRDSRKKVSRIQFKESFTEAELQSEDAVADALVAVEEATLELQRDEALHKALSELTPNCQEALKLYYFQNKNMSDIAAARLLANADQAKKAVHRCREALRRIVQGNPILQNILKQLS